MTGVRRAHAPALMLLHGGDSSHRYRVFVVWVFIVCVAVVGVFHFFLMRAAVHKAPLHRSSLLRHANELPLRGLHEELLTAGHLLRVLMLLLLIMLILLV